MRFTACATLALLGTAFARPITAPVELDDRAVEAWKRGNPIDDALKNATASKEETPKYHEDIAAWRARRAEPLEDALSNTTRTEEPTKYKSKIAAWRRDTFKNGHNCTAEPAACLEAWKKRDVDCDAHPDSPSCLKSWRRDDSGEENLINDVTHPGESHAAWKVKRVSDDVKPFIELPLSSDKSELAQREADAEAEAEADPLKYKSWKREADADADAEADPLKYKSWKREADADAETEADPLKYKSWKREADADAEAGTDIPSW